MNYNQHSHGLALLRPSGSCRLSPMPSPSSVTSITPLPFFDRRAPSDLLDTDEGLQLVEQTLIRIEHNVFS
jgi:hypothetical protein